MITSLILSLLVGKKRWPQLSHGWLNGKNEDIINHVRQSLGSDFAEFEKILNRAKNYKTAVVYASENSAIDFAGKMDDNIQDIDADTMIDSFELIKLN